MKAAISLRPARLDECPVLDDICFRAKAHWGYDADFMASVRDQIRVNPAAIDAGRVWVAGRWCWMTVPARGRMRYA